MRSHKDGNPLIRMRGMIFCIHRYNYINRFSLTAMADLCGTKSSPDYWRFCPTFAEKSLAGLDMQTSSTSTSRALPPMQGVPSPSEQSID